MKINRDVRGQSLIEIVVAIGIIAVVLVGVSDSITRSLSLAIFQAYRNEATNIAQNQLNYYRQARDREPANFFLVSAGNPDAEYHVCIGTFDVQKYTCSISYSPLEVDTGVKMTVKIVWKYGNDNINTELSQILTKPSK